MQEFRSSSFNLFKPGVPFVGHLSLASLLWDIGKQHSPRCDAVGLFCLLNPYLTNGFSHHYQLDVSTFMFRGVRGDYYVLSEFSMKFLCVNRIAPDGTPRSVAMLGLCCLPMSHKMTTRLIIMS